jgi:hypothetical protein
MVWDLFPFWAELDVLEIRLATLEDSVDVHVIAEATVNYAGEPKPLFLREAWSRFRRWHHKIRYVVVDDMPEGEDDARRDLPPCTHSDSIRWRRENHQREALARGLDGLHDYDLVHLSDADEIPSPFSVLAMAGVPAGMILRPAMPMHVGYLNWRWEEAVPVISRYLRGKTIRELGPQAARLDEGFITRGGVGWGWHCSYMGGPDAIRRKIASAAHAELQRAEFMDRARIEMCLATGEDLFGRPHRRAVWVPLSELPPPVQRNPARFRSLLIDRPW